MTVREFCLNRKLASINFVLTKAVMDISFIGIDRSLTSSGFAVVRNGQLVHQLEISVREYDVERLIGIVKKVIAGIHDYVNPFVVMEGYAFSAHASHAHELGELGGVLKMAFALKGITYVEVEPTALKKYISGKGNRPKDLIPMDVANKFKVDPIGGDAADAIGCAFFGYNLIAYLKKQDKPFLSYEKEVFDTFCSSVIKKKKKKQNAQQLALDIRE